MWGFDSGMMGYGWYGFGHAAVWILIVVLLIAAVVWAVRASPSGETRTPGPRRSSGLDVLDERYARGEIGRDEYLQKKADLGG